MRLPTALDLCDVIDATWPAATKVALGPITLREGLGGGSRVSAATATRQFDETTLGDAEDAMRAWGQAPQFMLRPGDDSLDQMLEASGYRIKDPTNLYVAPIADIAATKPPPVTSFQVWPPMEVQREIWAEGGIGPDRIAIMRRADCRKVSFLGRVDDRPAGTVYAGIFNKIAMLHALEVLSTSRRKGLAANLTRAVAIWGQKHKASHLALATTRDNLAANALYASLGMRLVGQYHYRIKADA